MPPTHPPSHPPSHPPTAAGTSHEEPVNPILDFAVEGLGLQLRPKRREGAAASLLFDRCAAAAAHSCQRQRLRPMLRPLLLPRLVAQPLLFSVHTLPKLHAAALLPVWSACREGRRMPVPLHLAAEEKCAQLMEQLLER